MAGLYVLPMAAMTAICAPLAGRIVGSRGTRLPLVIAGVCITVAGVLLTHLENGSSAALLVSAYLIFGLGFGMVNAPITTSTLSGMPRAQAGVAAGVASTSRQIGSSLGVAVLGSVTVSALDGSFRHGFATASHAAWWVMVGCGVAIFGLGLLVSGKWAHRTAMRTAALLPESAEPDESGRPDLQAARSE
jgi:MFS family permease